MRTVPLHRCGDADWVTAVARDLAAVSVAVATDVVGPRQRERLTAALGEAVAADARLLPAERRETEVGRVVYLPSYGEPFLSLLDDGPLFWPPDATIGTDHILYTMTSACTPPGGPGRSLHRDSALAFDGFVPAVAMMILLDDFDEPSGATRFHPEVTSNPPGRDVFDASSLRLVAPAGSVCWFHGATWHDATPNLTDRPRRCLILAVSRPWIRQRVDVPAMLADLSVENLSAEARWRIGLGVAPPGSYEEYYLPASEREQAIVERARRGRSRRGSVPHTEG